MGELLKRVQYTASNSYLTLNELVSGTRNAWMVFHGIGYLSRYFIAHFKDLDPVENYIVAPQAPSKYYLNNEYRHVGASWLTREDTSAEVQNVLNYIDAVYKAEAIPPACRLMVLGFSQGVSVAARWVARSRIPCARLLLYAGGIPEELKPGDFDFLPADCQTVLIVGENDDYLNATRLKSEMEKARSLFGERLEVVTFTGGHEMNGQVLKDLSL